MHLLDGLNFLEVHLNSSARYHEPQKFARSHTEGTLGWVQLHLILSDGDEGLIEIINVGPYNLALDEHVININFHVSSDLIFEDFVH